MKTKKLIMGGLFAAALAPSVVLATPQKFAQCPITLKQPTNSAGYFWSADCKTAYVLPPRTGNISVNGYTPTVSQHTCEAIDLIEERNRDFEDIETSTVKAVKRRAKKVAKYEQMLEDGDLDEGMTEEDIMDEIDDLLEKIADQSENIDKHYERYISKKGDYAVMEGGIGSINLNTGYSELMNEYMELNEGSGVSFQKMPLKNNTISVVDRTFKSEQNKIEMSALKRVLIAESPQHYLPVQLQDTAAAVSDKDQVHDYVGNQISAFGDGIGGQIETSALGDCAIRRAVGDRPDFTFKELRSYVTASSFYEYELQAHRKYLVTYNFKELVHIIRESSKRGGFFSRKTVNKLIENRSTDSWLKFESMSNDGEINYSEKEKREIRAEFLDRALRQILDARSDGKASALALIDPSGKNGSQVIGDELAKCPHLYCQIGAAGFKILGAIFGSEKATSEVLKTLKGDVRESSDERPMIKFVGASSFE